MGGSCAFHLYYIPCNRLSNFIVLISEIQPIKYQNKQKNPNHKHETHHISYLKNFTPRLHGILALVCSWGDNSGIKPKPFGFGSVFCWIGTEITASRLQAWSSRSGFPSTRGILMQWYGLQERGCQAPGVFAQPAEGWGMMFVVFREGGARVFPGVHVERMVN